MMHNWLYHVCSYHQDSIKIVFAIDSISSTCKNTKQTRNRHCLGASASGFLPEIHVRPLPTDVARLQTTTNLAVPCSGQTDPASPSGRGPAASLSSRIAASTSASFWKPGISFSETLAVVPGSLVCVMPASRRHRGRICSSSLSLSLTFSFSFVSSSSSSSLSAAATCSTAQSRSHRAW